MEQLEIYIWSWTLGKWGSLSPIKELVAADHPGSKAWLIAMRSHAKRHGPVALPSAGPPLLIFPRRDMFVHIMPAQVLCDQGLPVQNFEHYISTPEGTKQVNMLGSTLFLQLSSCLFLPAGYFVTAVFHKDLQKKKGGAEESYIFGFALVIPLPFKSQLDAMPPNVKRAFRQWHISTTKEHKKQMWLDRTAFLEQVLCCEAA